MMLIRMKTTEYLKEISDLNRKLRVLVKEKYTQLCLALRFGGINTIGFIQTLGIIINQKS